MRGRKRVSLFLAAAGVGGLLLSGCGKRTMSQIAFVDNTMTKSAENNEAVFEAGEEFSQKYGVPVTRIRPESTDLANIEKCMEDAALEGADTIVCYGQEMGRAVYDLQRMERKTRFIFVDGMPEGDSSGGSSIRDNTTCIAPAQEQAGFLAGYAAVYEGLANIEVLGAAADSAGRRQVSGFVQGAEQAAADSGTGSVQVTVRYLGSNTASPSLLTEIEGQLANGLQLIYAYETGPEFLAASAAAESGGKVIVYGGTEEGVPDAAVAASASFDYRTAAYRALEMEKEHQLPGGEKVTLAAEDGGAVMELMPRGFSRFTQEQYDSLVRRIASGEITITDDDVTDTENTDYTLTRVVLVKE